MHHQPTLTVNLAGIVRNYYLLQSRHHTHTCAAVVKANAYGLGVVPVAHALAQAGCPVFFVATLDEGIELRAVLPETPIYVLQGVLQGDASALLEHDLRPVLNSPEQVVCWKKGLQVAADDVRARARAALHVDTGMCRLGLSADELIRIENPHAFAQECHLDLLMSHLACASEPNHSLNIQQRERFDAARAGFPYLATSFVNSAGHFLSSDFHGDLGRPGCSLYGITPNPSLPNPMENVVTLTAPILRIRNIEHEQTIGYGATRIVYKGQKVAVVGFGYADGLHRIASNRLSVFIEAYEAPMLGRVSMDMTCYDVTHIPQAVLEKAAYVTIIGTQQSVDHVAGICETIGYEVFTSLGNRVKRDYRDA